MLPPWGTIQYSKYKVEIPEIEFTASLFSAIFKNVSKRKAVSIFGNFNLLNFQSSLFLYKNNWKLVPGGKVMHIIFHYAYLFHLGYSYKKSFIEFTLFFYIHIKTKKNEKKT